MERFMSLDTTNKNGTIVVSALRGGIPKAVLLSIRDYVKLDIPERQILRWG
jgi:hypothetical protein